MRVLRLFSLFIGYSFFVRLNSLVSFLVSASLNRKLKKVSGVAKFQYPLKAMGLENIEIGSNFSSGKGLRIQAISKYGSQAFNPEIIIGNNVTMNPNCQIVAINRIIIGDNVLIASNVFISDHSHGISDFSDISTSPASRDLDSKGGIYIGDNVWLGQNVSILANTKIGNNSVIGANSVVSKDIPDFCVAVGSPARVIRHLNKREEC